MVAVLPGPRAPSASGGYFRPSAPLSRPTSASGGYFRPSAPLSRPTSASGVAQGRARRVGVVGHAEGVEVLVLTDQNSVQIVSEGGRELAPLAAVLLLVQVQLLLLPVARGR